LKFEKGQSKQILSLDIKNAITSIFKIQDRNFLITKKGIMVENEQQEFEQDQMIFKGINCNNIIADREMNYWIGTTGDGIIFIPSLEMKIYNANNSSLAKNQIFSLDWNKENEELYVGHDEAKLSIVDAQKISNFNFNSSGRILDITSGNNNNLFRKNSRQQSKLFLLILRIEFLSVQVVMYFFMKTSKS